MICSRPLPGKKTRQNVLDRIQCASLKTPWVFCRAGCASARYPGPLCLSLMLMSSSESCHSSALIHCSETYAFFCRAGRVTACICIRLPRRIALKFVGVLQGRVCNGLNLYQAPTQFFSEVCGGSAGRGVQQPASVRGSHAKLLSSLWGSLLGDGMC